MFKNNEKNILRIIKYAPLLFIVLLSTLTTYLLILNNQNIYKEDIKKIEHEFILHRQKEIKLEVEKIYDFILYKKNKSEERLKAQLKSRVNEAHAIATNIYKQNRLESKAKILKMIKDALRQIRFNEGRGYYFIHDIQGNNRLYPLDKTQENKNFLNLKDTNGYEFVKTIVKTIKNKTETFDSYYWSKPTNEGDRIHKKISYYKYFAPLNISISTGEYLEDFEADVKEEIKSYIKKLNEKNQRYVFLLDYNNKIIVHKSLNSNIIVTKEQKQKRANLIKTIVNKAKQEDGFLTYNKNCINDTLNEKISYVKRFDTWNWVIGTGFYKSEFTKIIEEKKQEVINRNRSYIINILIISAIITVILLIISFTVSNLIKKRFILYKEKIYEEVNKNRKKDSLLEQQSKMAAMGEMIGNIAHQWRQPLSLISTISSGLKMQKEFGTLNDKDIDESVDAITKATKHLSKTIDDFKNFFKPNKEKQHFTTKGVIEKSLSLISAQFKAKSIEIEKRIEDIEIFGLENELIQVLINILNNARDELVKKEQELKLITIEVKKIEQKVQFVISDNAGGVPQEIINKVFEPYFSTKKEQHGTGIGLYMSKEIISKNMNGDIKVTNYTLKKQNLTYKGAKFIISLPISVK
ncbi:histidine kinase [Malaciobacter halophilus]|uniref:histidine kinase n=1 Tax=Malaciobacter halophilus TaxID=197482 RepID=A0A2N1J0Y4_9BACT|nr:cache domain-containing protein [Malaciobacter halophilus]AXH08435.1 Cache sensor-containing signal transduction histidine kinase [Malaciobacter halophilus]PKI80154.1 histidine kinase [Malaciobacter halophilus]